MENLRITETSEGIVISVKVVPGSSKTAIAGIMDEMLKIKVAAPPEKGKANKSLISFLAKLLNIKKNDIIIASGHTSAVKQLKISGVSADDFNGHLADI